MSINLKIPDIRELKPRITVFGVGGAGGNAVNNMIAAGLQGCVDARLGVVGVPTESSQNTKVAARARRRTKKRWICSGSVSRGKSLENLVYSTPDFQASRIPTRSVRRPEIF